MVAYSKPILVLVDELTASAAELFAAVMQDEGRAMIFGLRTSGAGGAVLNFDVGFYMEASCSLAQSILVRKHDIQFPAYPQAPYVENIGVIPDWEADYMRVDNLLQQGKPFVEVFSKAVGAQIDRNQ